MVKLATLSGASSRGYICKIKKGGGGGHDNWISTTLLLESASVYKDQGSKVLTTLIFLRQKGLGADESAEQRDIGNKSLKHDCRLFKMGHLVYIHKSQHRTMR